MRKLLLADDSVTIQRVIELTFSGEDIQVVAVNDGEQAIARIPAERPDVVLADIGMPRKGGYDVAAFVKGRPDLSHIPVLLLAGAFEPVDQTRAAQVGADGVLIKPFEPRHVIERVRELLAAVRPTISGEVVPEPVVAVEETPADPPVGLLPIGSDAEPDAPPPDATPANEVQSLDELFESLNQAVTGRIETPATPPPPAMLSWPADKAWPRAIRRDESPAVSEVERDSFEKARHRATSASTLDDYFDRLSAAFSHTPTASPAASRPDPVDDVVSGAAVQPPATSYEWLPQPREPRGLTAFENGEGGDGNPIVNAMSTLMARAQSDVSSETASHTPPTAGGKAASPELTDAPPTAGAAAPPADLADIITERVLARLMPELTKRVRRLVQQEIARSI